MEPEPPPLPPDPESGDNNGVDNGVEIALNDWSPAKAEYDAAQKTGNQGAIEAASQRLKLASIKLHTALVTIDGDFTPEQGEEFSKKLDFSKELTPEAQGFADGSPDAKMLGKITLDEPGKLRDTVNNVQNYFTKHIFTEDYLKQMSESKDNPDLQNQLLNRGFEIIDKAANDITDTVKREQWKTIAKYLFYALFSAGIITGGVLLGEWIKKLLCNQASKESGCLYQVKDGAQERVRLDVSKLPASCNVNNYDTTCGGCKKGYLQPGIMPECCNAAVAVGGTKTYPGPASNFSYSCVSAGDVFDNFWKGIGNWVSPSNIEALIEKIGMIIAIIVIIVIVLYIGRWVLHVSEE